MAPREADVKSHNMFGAEAQSLQITELEADLRWSSSDVEISKLRQAVAWEVVPGPEPLSDSRVAQDAAGMRLSSEQQAAVSEVLLAGPKASSLGGVAPLNSTQQTLTLSSSRGSKKKPAGAKATAQASIYVAASRKAGEERKYGTVSTARFEKQLENDIQALSVEAQEKTLVSLPALLGCVEELREHESSCYAC